MRKQSREEEKHMMIKEKQQKFRGKKYEGKLMKVEDQVSYTKQ